MGSHRNVATSTHSCDFEVPAVALSPPDPFVIFCFNVLLQTEFVLMLCKASNGGARDQETIALPLNPYTQITAFPTANKPILSLLFPNRGSTNVLRAREGQRPSQMSIEPPVDDEPVIHLRDSCDILQRESGVHHQPTESVRHRRVGLWCEQLEVPEDRPSPRSSAGGSDTHSEALATTEVTSLKDDVVSISPVHFRKHLRELDNRFAEQLHVHRELSAAMEQLESVEQDVRLHCSEVRTTTLAAAVIARQQVTLAKVFPGVTLSSSSAATPWLTDRAHPDTSSKPVHRTVESSHVSPVVAPSTSPPPVNPFLKDILQMYSKPLSERRGTAATPQEGKPVAKKLPTDVVRPPEEARPYRRVQWVRIEEPPPSPSVAYTADFDGMDSVVSGRVSGAITGDSFLVTSPTVHTDVSVPVSSRSNGGGSFSTDASFSAAHSTAIEDDLQKRAPTSVVSSFDRAPASDGELFSESRADVDDSEVASSIASSTSPVLQSRRDLSTSVSNAALIETLKQFYAACTSANRLMDVLQWDGVANSHKAFVSRGHARLRGKHIHGADPTTIPADTSLRDGVGFDDQKQWLELLRHDITDVKRLRRFIGHLQKNIHAIDLHRKTQLAKKKLLTQARKLARARRGLQQNRTAVLEDVTDDVSDLFGATRIPPHASDDDASMIDEVASAVDSEFGLGNNSDSIEEDDTLMGIDSSGAASMDDEIADEFDLPSGGGSGDSGIDDIAAGAIDDDVAATLDDTSGAALDIIEDDFAGRLAEVSDVDDIMDQVEDLPYTSDDAEKKSTSFPSVEDVVMCEHHSASSIASLISSESASTESPLSSVGAPPHDPHETDSVTQKEVTKKKRWESSSPSMQSSNDADISSLRPHSTTESGISSIEGISDALEELEGETALAAWEKGLAHTKQRRTQALLSIRIPPFSRLYDPALSTPSLPPSTESSLERSGYEDVALRLDALREASERVSIRDTGRLCTKESDQIGSRWTHPKLAKALEGRSEYPPPLYATEEQGPTSVAVQPPASSTTVDPLLCTLFAVKEQEANVEMRAPGALSLPTVERADLLKYPADDLVAQECWKERQKALFKELFLPLPEEDHTSGAERGAHPGYDVNFAELGLSSADRESAGCTSPQKLWHHASISAKGPFEEAGDQQTLSFTHHWAVLESLLETRFASHELPDYDDWTPCSSELSLQEGGSDEDHGYWANSSHTPISSSFCASPTT